MQKNGCVFSFALPKTQLPCGGSASLLRRPRSCPGRYRRGRGSRRFRFRFRLRRPHPPRGGSSSGCGGPRLRRRGRPGGGQQDRRRSWETGRSGPGHLPHPGGPDGEGVLCVCSVHIFSLEPCHPPGGAGLPVLVLCGAPPRDASRAAVRGRWGSQRLSPPPQYSAT